jgi:hypothetical protein
MLSVITNLSICAKFWCSKLDVYSFPNHGHSNFILKMSKASFLVKKFKLTKDFETDFISLGEINGTSLLQLGLMIIGVYLLVGNIADLLINASHYLGDLARDKVNSGNMEEFHPSPQFLNSLIKSKIGLLILKKSKWISNLLHKDSI